MRSIAETYQQRYNYKPLVKSHGQFFVASFCEGCRQCIELAGDFMAYNPQTKTSFVYRQPLTPEEIERVNKAIASCPRQSLVNMTNIADRSMDENL